jgi:hypothetical protein
MAGRNRSFFNLNSFVPKEYLYPEDSLLNGKVFVMEGEQDSALSYFEKKVRITPSGRVLTEKITAFGSTVDSTIYLNDQMVETYRSINDNQLSKGYVIHDTAIKDGSKFGEDFLETIFHVDSTDELIISSHLHFLKDTIIERNNRSWDCFEIGGVFGVKYNTQKDVHGKNLAAFNTLYFAKGIGLMRYSTQESEVINSFHLKEIRSSASAN